MKKTKIDKLGRIVIPISYRKELNITTETDIIIECNKSIITISPSSSICKICEKSLDSDSSLPICKNCILKIKSLKI